MLLPPLPMTEPQYKAETRNFKALDLPKRGLSTFSVTRRDASSTNPPRGSEWAAVAVGGGLGVVSSAVVGSGGGAVCSCNEGSEDGRVLVLGVGVESDDMIGGRKLFCGGRCGCAVFWFLTGNENWTILIKNVTEVTVRVLSSKIHSLI